MRKNESALENLDKSSSIDNFVSETNDSIAHGIVNFVKCLLPLNLVQEKTEMWLRSMIRFIHI